MDIDRLIAAYRGWNTDRLIAAYRGWNTEDSKYMCLGLHDNIYFSNNLDCDGARYWTKKSFEKMMVSSGRWKG